MADVALLLASTGMRTGELLGLQWTDADLEAGEVHIAATTTDGGPGVGFELRRDAGRGPGLFRPT